MTEGKPTREDPHLVFDNRFVAELPGDPVLDTYPRQVRSACYSLTHPTSVAAPGLVAYSHEMAELLNLSPEWCRSQEFADIFTGNQLLPGMECYAVCYGGHQFGHWAGQLGDGRAIALGEVINKEGARWVLQLKGAGPTPYSRQGDGRAVLRSSVREFLCSEAMHHLGVPTTRALSLTTTGEKVVRDMFYDGNPQEELGAVVCRVAPSFLRFGNFEIVAAQKDPELLRKLMDFTLSRDFPHLGAPSVETYGSWFQEVCTRTAEMIVHWMRVGFVHGVMNTDNMSILGLTIDYGPYGWVDNFDLGWTPNTTDASGKRYRFGNQPGIAFWNLVQLANAIHPIVGEAQILEKGLKAYSDTFESKQQKMMAEKLGLSSFRNEEDKSLIEDLIGVLQIVETDMTLFFRGLAQVKTTEEGRADDPAFLAPLMNAYYSPDELSEDARQSIEGWLRRYIARISEDNTPDEVRAEAMNAVNPLYVLRNYLAQVAIDKSEEGDHSGVEELLDVMRHPYTVQSGKDAFAEKRPEWARHRAGCSMLSCSS